MRVESVLDNRSGVASDPRKDVAKEKLWVAK
jgi:hypothetical protein